MYDLVIKNVNIIDGTTAPSFEGAVAISDGKICKIGNIVEENALEVIDGKGCCLAPGFIDIHSHSDETLFWYSFAESRILQGVTTEFGGNCGLSVVPASENPVYREQLHTYLGMDDLPWNTTRDFLDAIEEQGSSVNFGMGIGHGALRIAAMGFDARKPTEDELQKMETLLEQAFDEGAFFLSSGLVYPPGCFADTTELAALAKVAARRGSFYATHMRDEGLGLVEATAEALEVARESKVSLQISHHKVTRKEGWHTLPKKTVSMIQQAREQGVDVWVDQYPYTATATSLHVHVPEWAHEGGIEKLLQRLSDEEMRKKMRAELAVTHKTRWDGIHIASVMTEDNQWTVGKSITEIASQWGKGPEDACFDLLLMEKGNVKIVNYCISEEDVEYIMKQNFTMFGSDGNAASFTYPGQPHPRSFGTFPRVIRKYCKEKGILSLETAIHKMTGLPAKRLGLTDRGIIQEGMWADLVLFDFDEIEDTPSFEAPKQGCKGIKRVYVNGVLTALNGAHTGEKAGRILRKKY